MYMKGMLVWVVEHQYKGWEGGANRRVKVDIFNVVNFPKQQDLSLNRPSRALQLLMVQGMARRNGAGRKM
jgi:hypothetical protein